jgi:hypothetical protein
MPRETPNLFAGAPEPEQFKNCVRCNIRCRVAARVNPHANLFVKGDARTGKFCVNCLVVDFFKNCEHGPASAMGKEYFDHSLPQPEWRKEVGDSDRRFDPECLRDPAVQQQFAAIVAAARREYGAELVAEEIDWDEVVANWHLPFPPRKGNR